MRITTVPETDIKGIEADLYETWTLYNPDIMCYFSFNLQWATEDNKEHGYWVKNGIVAVLMENKLSVFPETPEVMLWLKEKKLPQKRMYVPFSDNTHLADPNLDATWREMERKYIIPNWENQMRKRLEVNDLLEQLLKKLV